MNPRLEGMIKSGEVARRLGITAQTVRNYAETKRLVPDFVSDSGTAWYRVEKVEKFLEEVKSHA